MENYDKNRAPKIYILLCVYLLRDIELVGYVENDIDTRKLTIAKEKSTMWINFDIKIKFWHR